MSDTAIKLKAYKFGHYWAQIELNKQICQFFLDTVQQFIASQNMIQIKLPSQRKTPSQGKHHGTSYLFIVYLLTGVDYIKPCQHRDVQRC